MFGIFGGTETRRLPGRFQVPWKEILFVVIVLIAVGAVAFGAKVLYSNFTGGESAAPAQAVEQPVAQPFDTTQGEPVQQAPVAAPVKEWPKIEVVWRYALTIAPVPYVDDPLYNGKMSQGTWWSPGSTPADPIEVTRHEIAGNIVPSITDRDLVGLSITRNRDNPAILLAAVWIQRDVQTAADLIARKEFAKSDEASKLQRNESHLGLSVDNGETWRIISLSFSSKPDIEAIDDVLSTGTSPILITIRPFSSPGYWQAEVLP